MGQTFWRGGQAGCFCGRNCLIMFNKREFSVTVVDVCNDEALVAGPVTISLTREQYNDYIKGVQAD
jgi:hypothetical protein